LEGVNKVFGSRILISESTQEQIKDIFLTRQLDRLRVKGKQKPIRVYELVGKNGEVAPELLARIDHFQEGIRCYNERSFVEALKIFQSILADFPTDGPSKVYVDRCNRFIVSPPPEDWDGVFKMETK